MAVPWTPTLTHSMLMSACSEPVVCAAPQVSCAWLGLHPSVDAPTSLFAPTHPPTYPSTHPHTHPTTQPPTHPTTHPPNHLTTPADPSSHPLTHSPTRPPRSVGCILAELLLRKPLFPGKDYIHQLNLIMKVGQWGGGRQQQGPHVSDVAETLIRRQPAAVMRMPCKDGWLAVPGADAGLVTTLVVCFCCVCCVWRVVLWVGALVLGGHRQHWLQPFFLLTHASSIWGLLPVTGDWVPHRRPAGVCHQRQGAPLPAQPALPAARALPAALAAA
jgi:hypothetical protein